MKSLTSRFARLLLIFAAFCLPLQALAGLSMQLVRADSDVQAALVAASDHCPYHDAAGDDTAAGNGHAGSDSGCNNCGVCHLACSGYLPSASVSVAAVPAAQPYLAWRAPALPSNIPEPPHHPPKRTA